jgi:hypothetical protein
LLDRLNHGVQRDFAFHYEKRWARLYGVLKTTRRRKRNEDADEDCVFTGNRRYRNQAFYPLAFPDLESSHGNSWENTMAYGKDHCEYLATKKA